MSTSMYATTVLVDPSMTSHVFEDAEALMCLEPARLNPAPGLKLFSASESWVIDKVYGDSRRDFFSQAVEDLCTLSGIHGLEFFHGNLEMPWRWKLPLGIEDGEENVYGYACGYWLEGAELAAAHAALSRLLKWSKTNIKRIKDGAILGEYFSRQELLKMIEDGARMESPRMKEAWHAEDGDGLAYVFAYLGTACHLMGNALSSRHAVVHVAEILF